MNVNSAEMLYCNRYFLRMETEEFDFDLDFVSMYI